MGGYISAAQQVFVRNKCERTPAFRLLQKIGKELPDIGMYCAECVITSMIEGAANTD